MDFRVHGWMLWGAWSILALVQIASNRYVKGRAWRYHLWLHRIGGFLALALTLFAAFWAWHFIGWYVIYNWHTVFVFPVGALITFLVLGGLAADRVKATAVWNTKTALRAKVAHGWFGWFVILLGQAAVFTGIHYYRRNPAHASSFPLEYLQVALAVAVFLAMEIVYRMDRAKEIPFRAPASAGGMQTANAPITIDAFQQLIAAGRKVVILDDMVLDVAKFMGGHPGGTFALEHNVGRDVSKFFHGGYALENIDKVSNHTHSTDARRAVNSLIIGRLVDEAPVRIVTVQEADRNANLSGSCRTIRFK